MYLWKYVILKTQFYITLQASKIGDLGKSHYKTLYVNLWMKFPTESFTHLSNIVFAQTEFLDHCAAGFAGLALIILTIVPISIN
jgi:hypothetical protein